MYIAYRCMCKIKPKLTPYPELLYANDDAA